MDATTRESIAASLNQKDEAALIDSFFLPGGILDPDQEEEEQQEETRTPYPPGLSTGAGLPAAPGLPVPTANAFQWNTNDAPPLVPVPQQPAEETHEDAVEPNSFWSTRNTIPSSEPPPGLPFATNSATPEPWMLAATLEDNIQQANNKNAQDPAPTLFPYTKSLNSLQSSQQGSDLVAKLPHPAPPTVDPLQQHLQALQFTTPLPAVGQLGTATSTTAAAATAAAPTSGAQPPSAQEVEDVRKMVLVLSSSLQNIGGSSEHNPNLPEHLLRPDSPPKIIRRRSSSTHRVNSIPLELPDSGAAGGSGHVPNDDDGDEDEDDFLIDHQSTTSSLSSGSAKRDDSHHSHSPVPLSVHYRPPETSFLAATTEQPKQQSFLGALSGGGGELFPPVEQPQQVPQPPPQQQRRASPPSSALLSSSAAVRVAPPPGYQHLPPPQRLRFATEDEEEPPPPLPSSSAPAVVPPLTIQSPPEDRQELPPSQQESQVSEPVTVHEEGSWQQVLSSKEPRKHELHQSEEEEEDEDDDDEDDELEEQEEQQVIPAPPQQPAVRKPRPEGKRHEVSAPKVVKSATTTTTTVAADTTEEATKIVPASNTSKKKRSGRRQKASKKGAAGAANNSRNREPQLHQNDVLKTGKTPVTKPTAAPPRESPTRAAAPSAPPPPPSTTTSSRPVAPPKVAKPKTTSRTTVSIVVWFDNGMDFARRCVQFQFTLLSCMIQEAVKEAVERQSIAGCYAVMYFTPVMSDLIMDQCVWLPHFFPGITLGIVMALICRAMLKDQYLIETAAFNPTPFAAQRQQGDKVGRTSAARKKTRQATSKSLPQDNATVALSQKEHRLLELRSMEAKICISMLRWLRWILPTIVFAAAVVDRTAEEDIVPALRLVAAFGLSMLQTYNLFSPLAWISGSMQVLFALTMRNSHTYMERWCGVEVVVGSIGLSTLRFLRLGTLPRQKYV